MVATVFAWLNQMLSVDQFISMLGATGAIIAALATFFTIREMRRQTESSLRPAFIFSSIIVEGDSGVVGGRNLSKCVIPNCWRSNGIKAGADRISGIIPLVNCGLGSACNVHIYMAFDGSSGIEKLNEYVKKLNIEAEYVWYENGVVSVICDRDTGLHFGTSFYCNQINHVISIIPTIQSDESRRIYVDIPHSFVSIISSMIYLQSKLDIFDDDAFPGLKIRLEYTDILGSQMVSLVSYQMHIVSIAYGECVKFTGSLEPTLLDPGLG